MSYLQRVGLVWIIVNTGVYVKSQNDVITALAILCSIFGTILLLGENK